MLFMISEYVKRNKGTGELTQSLLCNLSFQMHNQKDRLFCTVQEIAVTNSEAG